MSSSFSESLPDNLWEWHAGAAVVHIISCLVLAFVTEFQWSSDFPGTVGPVTYTYTLDNGAATNASQSNSTNPTWSVGAQVEQEWVYANPVTGVAVNEGLTAASHIVGAVLARIAPNAMYESRRRWLEYSVTAGILEICLLLAYGVRDWFALLLVFALNAALQLGGGAQLDALRRAKGNAASDVYAEQKIWLLFQSFLFLFVQIFYTVTMAATSAASAAVFASSVTYAVFYASFGVLQTCSHCSDTFDEWFDTSNAFCLLSVTSKLCLSYHIVLVGKQIENGGGNVQDTVDGLNAGVIVLYVVSGLAAVLYTVVQCNKRDDNTSSQGAFGTRRA